MTAFGYRKISDLPETVSLFPVTSAILFPRAALPLNVFEPRYLNMVDDALAGDRTIAMIQPAFAPAAEGALAGVGALGRITAFAEADDGRYLITLTGICRFRIAREIPGPTPYRRALADYGAFASDLAPPRAAIDRDELRAALERFVDIHGYEADWSAVEDAPSEALVNSIAAMCPFDPPSKQALLEAMTLSERCETLIALLNWSADKGDNASGRMQ